MNHLRFSLPDNNLICLFKSGPDSALTLASLYKVAGRINILPLKSMVIQGCGCIAFYNLLRKQGPSGMDLARL